MHRELQAVAETDSEFNLQSATDVWQALRPKIEQLSTLEAQNSIKLQQLLQHQNSEASSLITGMQLYFGIGHISIMVTLSCGVMGAGGDREFPKTATLMFFLFFFSR